MTARFSIVWSSLRERGAKATLRSISMYVCQTFFDVQPDLVQRRYHLGQRLSHLLNATISYGPFAGTQLAAMNHWSAADRGSMLLGMYEKEVLAELVRLSEGRDILVDVGAADGYYAIGSLTGGLVSQALCFELDTDGQRMITLQAELNNVQDFVTVLGAADECFVNSLGKHFPKGTDNCVFLIDIEGAEFELLTYPVLEAISPAPLIIELHDFEPESRQAAESLIDRVSRYYDSTIIHQGDRNPNQFVELKSWSDDDRWLLCSESRVTRMRWLVCEPKA